jgi:hypothetical protein
MFKRIFWSQKLIEIAAAPCLLTKSTGKPLKGVDRVFPIEREGVHPLVLEYLYGCLYS